MKKIGQDTYCPEDVEYQRRVLNRLTGFYFRKGMRCFECTLVEYSRCHELMKMLQDFGFLFEKDDFYDFHFNELKQMHSVKIFFSDYSKWQARGETVAKHVGIL